MKKILVFLGSALLILLVFKNWFSPTLLAGGDWVYYFPKSIQSTTLLSSWDDRYSGFGTNKIIKLPLEVYFISTMKSSQWMSWQLYERIFWFFPFLGFSLLSPYFLSRKIIGNSSFAILGSVFYATNTYSLMLIGGGQNGIALAYAFLPFVLLSFINLIENSESIFFSFLFTLAFSILVLFDVRVVYVCIIMLIFISVFNISSLLQRKFFLKRLLYVLVIPSLLILGIHAFWLVPLILARGSSVNQFGDIYTSLESVKFFSFATFENAVGILHPNWPENIFGKISFMRPEFIVYPILAFSSLLFVRQSKEKIVQKKNIYVLVFVLISILGIFLSKGANDPFGGIYLWMFGHIPGFVMFRDPTKWYMLIAVSYSILIPYATYQIFLWIKRRLK